MWRGYARKSARIAFFSAGDRPQVGIRPIGICMQSAARSAPRNMTTAHHAEVSAWNDWSPATTAKFTQ